MINDNAERDRLAALDPSTVDSETRAKITEARSCQALDLFSEKGYIRNTEDVNTCMAAMLYAAGLLYNKTDLNQEEIAICFESGIRNAQALQGFIKELKDPKGAKA